MDEKTKKRITETIEKHQKMVAELQADGIETITAAADMIIESLRQGGCVYICGNGGSAADAQHIAGELVGRVLRERKALSAVALSTDTSIITSVANDYSYENIFERQVEALVSKNDVLWAISTSGRSANIISAIKKAKEKNASVLAFTGSKNCPMENLADVCFCAEAKLPFLTQQIHQIAYHIICDLVEQSFCEQ